ncbi:MAG: nuclease [Anaerolineaceae bacterium]|nr:nuclease [Anaerolineaceae bacterium]
MTKHFKILTILVVISVVLAGCDALSKATPLPEGDKISDIQGAGHISPLKGRPVYNVHGIVTAVRADGFYLQDPNPDDDPATSDGIFVYKGMVPRVKAGDEVLINAVVEEFNAGGIGSTYLTITQLEHPYIEVLSSGNDLPEPVILGEGGRIPPNQIIEDDANGSVAANNDFDPENDGLDFYESLEGMRVQVNDAVAVSGTSQYKEIAVVGDNGAHASGMTDRGGLVIQADDFNPERIILDDGMRQIPFVTTGDKAEGPIIGVMDYTYGNYKLQATESVKFSDSGLERETVVTDLADGQIRIADYNILNMSGKDLDRAETLADQIINQMGSPDIIGFQEIQDEDGSTSTQSLSADGTYQIIIDAILAAGGPEYGFVDIDPELNRDGGIPGGNIRVGFIYRLDRGISLAEGVEGDARTATEVLNVDGELALSLNPGRIDPTNVAFGDSRKPLVVTFEVNGETLYLINNHFNSKGGDSSLFGDEQPPVLESEVQRLLQAQVVHDFVAEMLAVDPDANIVVMGDLNDFQFSAPVLLLQGDLLTNLVNTLPVEERYSYIYDGNSQILDQMLVSSNLLEKLVEYDILHINSEFDYQNRFSDHDPALVVFDMN